MILDFEFEIQILERFYPALRVYRTYLYKLEKYTTVLCADGRILPVFVELHIYVIMYV